MIVKPQFIDSKRFGIENGTRLLSCKREIKF